MKNLFIIGNGFDIGHGLKTKYLDFKEYVEKNDPDFFQVFYTIHQFSFERKYENSLMIEPLEDEYETLWSNLEEHIKIVNENYILAANVDMGLEYYDPWDESMYETAREYLENLIEGVPELLFENLENWIGSIDISLGKKQTNYIRIDSNDLFLNFNYTDLLEQVYEIAPSQICYIHGRLGDELIMGHGNNDKIRELKKERDNFDDKIERLKYDLLIDYYEKTLKTPLHHIKVNYKFFNKISNIEKIYIIGHSLGKVDHPYFKEILNRTNPNIKWNIFYYNESEKDRFKTILLDIGVLEKNIVLENCNIFYNV